MRPVLVCVVFALFIMLGIFACTITPKHGPGVSIQEASVEIYPGTKISIHDQKALDAVLKHFNQSLYKIKTYDRGKLVKTSGTLQDARIDQTLVADATNASQKGVSYRTLQIGTTYQIDIGKPNRTNSYIWPMRSTPYPAPTSPEVELSKRLVSRVTPILQKYSQQPGLQSQALR